MGRKYIIELPENTYWIQWIMKGTKDGHPYMDFEDVEDLTPYTEPDTEAIEKVAYQRGLDDAWEAARKIASDHAGRNYSIFGQHFTVEILNTHSASEAIEKIRAYEEKAEQEIKVGDWVQNGGVIGVVTYIEQANDGICYHVLREDGHLWYLDDKVTKKYKGRVPEEIAGFLKKMKEPE